jgi:hypothetical protein
MICVSLKPWGVLGFRCAKKFNVALMAKLTWMLMSGK